MAGIDDETQPRNARYHWLGVRRGLMHCETQRDQEFDHCPLPFPELPLPIGKARNHPRNADRPAPEVPGDKLIERIHVNVRPELRCEIADRQTRGRQAATGLVLTRYRIVAGEVHHIVFFRQHAGTACQNRVHQPQHILIMDDFNDSRTQDVL